VKPDERTVCEKGDAREDERLGIPRLRVVAGDAGDRRLVAEERKQVSRGRGT
jgi:hypothetical protein